MPASLDCARSFELLSRLQIPQYISSQFSKRNSCCDSYFPIGGSVNSFPCSLVRMTNFFLQKVIKRQKIANLEH